MVITRDLRNTKGYSVAVEIHLGHCPGHPINQKCSPACGEVSDRSTIAARLAKKNKKAYMAFEINVFKRRKRENMELTM